MMRMTTTRPLLALLASGLLGACSLAPGYQRPAAPIAAQWPARDTATEASTASSSPDWQHFVQDAQLRALIALALEHNRDLRQAVLNVEAARAQYRVQHASLFPTLEAQASGTGQRLPADLSTSGRAGIQRSHQAGLELTAFELDLFGRLRNQSDAALAEYLASREGAHNARITLIGELIQAYLGHEGARQRHQLTAQTLQHRETALALITRRQQAGAASALDYQEARALTEQARADLQALERSLRQARNALELLVGAPGALERLGTPAAAPLVEDIAAGTPSSLLEWRPDIRAAEHRLRARNADIGAARAAFFPRISLTGLLGSASAELAELFAAGQGSWSFTPRLALPLFDGGRNQAGLDLALVRKDMAVAGYEQAVQTAFREVADALAASDTLRREEQARLALVQASAAALQLAKARYEQGVDGHLRYLDAQRGDLANQLALIEVRTQRQIALAALFKALGGGWRTDDGSAETAAATVAPLAGLQPAALD